MTRSPQPSRSSSGDTLPPTASAQVGAAGQLPVGGPPSADGAFYSSDAGLSSAGAAKGAAVRLEAPTEIEIKAARHAFAIRNPEILRRIENAVGYLMRGNVKPTVNGKPAPARKVAAKAPRTFIRRVADRLLQDAADGNLQPLRVMAKTIGVSLSTLQKAKKIAGVTLPDGRKVRTKTTPGQKRRNALVAIYSGADFDRSAFAAEWGVSRQSVVCDISKLRAAGRLPAYDPKKETK